jgi:hypothetical protein
MQIQAKSITPELAGDYDTGEWLAENPDLTIAERANAGCTSWVLARQPTQVRDRSHSQFRSNAHSGASGERVRSCGPLCGTYPLWGQTGAGRCHYAPLWFGKRGII